MPIATTCPKCEALFRLPDELAGRTVKCQKCATLFVAPMTGSETTMPGAPVALDVESAAEEIPALAASAAPLHGIGLPPMPTDLPSPPPRIDDLDQSDQYSDSPRKPPAVSTKAADDERPGRTRRGEKPKARSSSLGVVLGILGFVLLAFLVCGGATGIWYAVSADKQKKAPPLAKKGGFKDVRNKGIQFEEFKNPPMPGVNVPIENLPAFDGFKDGKLPQPPPPGPPGSIPVIFGPDGTFRNENVLRLDDPPNQIGRRHKLYIVRLEVGYTYQFDMMSDPKLLDAWVTLRDENGGFIAENDDILQGREQNARLIHTAKETGVYHLEATYCENRDMPNPVGNYTLTVRHVK